MPLALLVIALLAYVASTVAFVAHLLMKRAGLAQRGLQLLGVGLVLHAAGKIVEFSEQGTVPATDGVEAMGILALIVGVLFVFAARRYSVPVLGAFAVPLVVVTLAGSLAFGHGPGAVPDALRSAWFPVHIALAISADAFFAVAGVASVAYLVQERLLREKRLGNAFRKLPPLHILDEIAHRFISVGFMVMTLGIIAGSFFAKQKWGAYWSWDPKQCWSLMTWLLFAGILHARITVGWRGRRAAWLTLIAVVCVLIAIFGLGVLTPTRHGGGFS
jgi:cytochrome c-type biogenesis protein CcsB